MPKKKGDVQRTYKRLSNIRQNYLHQHTFVNLMVSTMLNRNKGIHQKHHFGIKIIFLVTMTTIQKSISSVGNIFTGDSIRQHLTKR